LLPHSLQDIENNKVTTVKTPQQQFSNSFTPFLRCKKLSTTTPKETLSKEDVMMGCFSSTPPKIRRRVSVRTKAARNAGKAPPHPFSVSLTHVHYPKRPMISAMAASPDKLLP